jgi:hypothetical protein
VSVVRNPTKFRRRLGFSRVVKNKERAALDVPRNGREEFRNLDHLGREFWKLTLPKRAAPCPKRNALPELTMPVAFLILMVQVLCGFSTNMLRDEAAL